MTSRVACLLLLAALFLAGGAQAQVNVLLNPGFESGRTGWSETSSANLAIITNDPAASRSGSWHAWLGGAHSIDDSIQQDVTVPAGGRLQFWYRISTNEPSSGLFLNFDILEVELYNPSTGVFMQGLDIFFPENTNGWVQSRSYDLSALAGQRVRLRFSVSTDREYTTNFRIDDISLTGTAASAANYTALWWNPAESGWGINVTHQGNVAFGTLFTYDSAGAPMWLVMSGGLRQGASETFTGDLYRTTGPTFNAVPFAPINASNLTRVGSMTLAFSSTGTAALTYTVNGVTVTKALQKQVFGSRAAICETATGSRATATNYQDLWWNAAESGWGVNLVHQGTVLFATLFTYGSNNQGLWLVMSGGTRQADGSYLGDLYRTTGPVFNAATWGTVVPTRVGTMRLRFQNGESATLEYSFNGVTVTKSITRQLLSSPGAVCTS